MATPAESTQRTARANEGTWISASPSTGASTCARPNGSSEGGPSLPPQCRQRFVPGANEHWQE